MQTLADLWPSNIIKGPCPVCGKNLDDDDHNILICRERKRKERELRESSQIQETTQS